MRIVLKGLQPDKNYSVQLRAKDGEYTSEWSVKFPFTTITDERIPNIPGNVTWVPQDGGFVANFDKVTTNTNGTGAKIIRYEIEIRNGSGLQPKVIALNPPIEDRYEWSLTPERIKSYFGSLISTVRFRVRAVNYSENLSAWSTVISASLGAPDAPTNAVITPMPYAVKVDWTPPVNMANVDGYRVYVSLSAGSLGSLFYQGNASTFTYQTFRIQTVYFQIKSYSKFGMESTSLTASGTSEEIVDGTPPATPGSVAGSITTAPDGKSATANITWTLATPPADLAGFNIRYRPVGQTVWLMVNTTDTERAATFAVLPYTNYEVQVHALDKVGNFSGWSGTVTISGATNVAPVGVSGLAVVGISTPDSIQYTWNTSSDGDVSNRVGRYDLEVSTSSTFATSTIFRAGDPGMAVTGLFANTIHYARVRAVDGAGLVGPWSATVTATTGSYPVTPLSDGSAPASSPTPTTIGGLGYIYVSWLPVTNNDVVTYEVHISTTTGFTPAAGTKTGEVTGTSMVVEALSNGTTLAYGTPYYIKLIAKDKDGAAAAGAQVTGSLTKATILDLTLIPADIGASTTAQMNTAIATSSNGVNRTYWSTLVASGTTDGSRNYVNGDTWMQRDGTGKVIAQWEFVTGAWVARTLSHQVISSIDVGNMTVLGQLGAANILASSLTISQSQVPSLTTDLSARPLATTVNGQVAAAQTGAVTDIKTLWGHSLNTTLINGGNIFTNTIRANSIMVADFSNYLTGSDFEDATQTLWTLSNGAVVDTVQFRTGSKSLKITGTAANKASYPAIPTSAGTEYFVSFWVRRDAAWNGLATNSKLRFADQSAAFVASIDFAAASLPTPDVWVRRTGIVTAPAGATTLTTLLVSDATAGNVWIDDIQMMRRNSGEFIIDGTVTANKITAGEYTGGAFVIGTGGILRTFGSEVVITSTGITVGAGASGGISTTKLTSGDITATNTINVLGTLKVTSSGWIESSDFASSGGTTGYRLTNTSLTMKTGSVSVATLSTGTIGNAGAVGITLNGGSSIVINSGHVRGGGYQVGTYLGGSVGFYLGSDGLHIASGAVSASALTSGTITAQQITLAGANSYISGTGWSISSAGITINGGTSSIAGITIAASSLTSSDYNATAGQYAGWKINASGGAIFNNVVVRGSIDGASITGSTMSSTTITGGTIETNGGLTSVIRMNSSGLKSFDSGGFNIVTIDATNEFQVRGNAAFYQHLSTGTGTFTVGAGVTATFHGAANFNTGINAIGGSTIGGGLTISTSGLTVSQGDVIMGSLSDGGLNDRGTLAVSMSPGNFGYVVVGAGGKLHRSETLGYGSALKLKENIEPLEITAKQVVSLRPYRYNFKTRPEQTRVGFIADYADELGLHDWVSKDEDGEVAGFNYIEFTVAQQVVLIDHDERVQTLEDKIATLESKITQLLSLLDS